jgi:hypothetical protein
LSFLIARKDGPRHNALYWPSSYLSVDSRSRDAPIGQDFVARKSFPSFGVSATSICQVCMDGQRGRRKGTDPRRMGMVAYLSLVHRSCSKKHKLRKTCGASCREHEEDGTTFIQDKRQTVFLVSSFRWVQRHHLVPGLIKRHDLSGSVHDLSCVPTPLTVVADLAVTISRNGSPLPSRSSALSTAKDEICFRAGGDAGQRVLRQHDEDQFSPRICSRTSHYVWVYLHGL